MTEHTERMLLRTALRRVQLVEQALEYTLHYLRDLSTRNNPRPGDFERVQEILEHLRGRQ